MATGRPLLPRAIRGLRIALIGVPTGLASYLAYSAGDGIHGALLNGDTGGSQIATSVRIAVGSATATLPADPFPLAATIGIFVIVLAAGPKAGGNARLFAWSIALASPPIALLVGIAYSSGDSRWV